MEFLAIAAVLLSAVLAIVLLARGHRRVTVGLVAAVLLLTAATLALWPRPTGAFAEDDLPEESEVDGYVSSKACQACHPSEYASWYKTYHRTMTQVISPATVLADFDDVDLQSRGIEYHLERTGDEFWVDMVDPDWEMTYIRQNNDPRAVADAPRRRKRVVMSTGSHHQQTYWVSLDQDRSLFQLPWTWLIKEGRWVPREDAFLHPPEDDSRTLAVWNASCIRCHAVGGNPKLVRATNLMNTTVGDFGVACEACHGPGGEHIALNRDPVRRYRLHLTGADDDTMVNPANLDHVRSSMVCAQCHSFHANRDKNSWWEEGLRYRPGDDLDLTQVLAGTTAAARSDIERFYADGTYRVGGREFTGMMRSACYTRGELSCLSCHSMHHSDPDDQLAEGMDGDAACTQCHDGFQTAEAIRSHTHHAVESTGSRCYNCHMPYTAYALFKGIRNHRIDIPSAAMTLRDGRPNACNQCHLDKTIAWTAAAMQDWYGQPAATTSDEQKAIAASVDAVLTGDAAMRVLMAWTLGWDEAKQASGEGWMGLYLIELLQDPYAAVRQVAYRSLRAVPGFADFEFDYVAPVEERQAAYQRALTIWRRRAQPTELGGAGDTVIAPPEVVLPDAVFQALLRRRDNQPIHIQE